jgi:hypothetical protein
MYRSSSAVRSAQVSPAVSVYDELLEKKILLQVAAMVRQEEYRQTVEALVSCGPHVDAPSDDDLKSRSVRVRF